MTRASTKLALDGGTPVRKEPILPGWPGGLLIGAEEKAQVPGGAREPERSIGTTARIPGTRSAELEQKFAAAIGARHALGRDVGDRRARWSGSPRSASGPATRSSCRPTPGSRRSTPW